MTYCAFKQSTKQLLNQLLSLKLLMNLKLQLNLKLLLKLKLEQALKQTSAWWDQQEVGYELIQDRTDKFRYFWSDILDYRQFFLEDLN